MKNEEKDKFLRPNPWRIILIFVGLYFVFEIIFLLSFLSALAEFFIWLSVILLAATVVFCIITIRATKYEITANKITHHKLGKTIDYFFNDILYIDEEFSEKHRMMLFYNKDGKEKFLLFDKEGKIYETALQKAHQITFEELQRRFPNVK